MIELIAIPKVKSIELIWVSSFTHGFKIYKNGELLTITNEKKYLDTQVTTGKNYTYQIGLINSEQKSNIVDVSPVSFVHTPQGLITTNYPNPWGTTTRINLVIPNDITPISLRIYNLAGQLIRTITVNNNPHLIWDGKNELGEQVVSGIYFCNLTTPNCSSMIKLVFQR